MAVGRSAPSYAAGRIPNPDRLQRLVIGGGLMLLNLSHLSQHGEWQGFVALGLQAELLVTGAMGWCPVYWACRRGGGADA